MKTLADFKQEVAITNGFNHWKHLYNSVNDQDVYDYLHEAFGLYVEYREKEIHNKYAIGHQMAKKEAFENGYNFGYKQGWNEALLWAADNATVEFEYIGAGRHKSTDNVNKQSILRGIKK